MGMGTRVEGGGPHVGWGQGVPEGLSCKQTDVTENFIFPKLCWRSVIKQKKRHCSQVTKLEQVSSLTTRCHKQGGGARVSLYSNVPCPGMGRQGWGGVPVQWDQE